MRSKLRAFLAISVVSAALTACSDQPTSAPIVPRVAGVNAIVNIPNDCNFSDLRAAVRAYVDAGNDEIYDYIGAMSADAYGQGMNALARLAEVRASTEDKEPGATPEQGATAVMEILACMPVGAAVQDNFATNIVAAMGVGGLFEVPAADADNAIFARGELPGTPFWTAKPKEDADWGSLTGQRVMLFGYKLSPSGDPLAGFDYNIVPMLPPGGTFQNDNQLVVGLCGYAPPAVRLKHITTSDSEILFDEDISCPPNAPLLGALSTRQGFNLASLARRSLSLFTPQPLHAAVAVFGGGVGGAISELSPTIPLSVTPTITYVQQPFTNKFVGDPLGIKISVFSGTDPLNNAEVTLTVTGNSGQAALFLANGTRCFQVTRTTGTIPGEPGVADFTDVAVLKSGGYTLTATAEFDGLGANAVLSNLFNVKNKKVTLPPSC